jgi:hypothetical protein
MPSRVRSRYSRCLCLTGEQKERGFSAPLPERKSLTVKERIYSYTQISQYLGCPRRYKRVWAQHFTGGGNDAGSDLVQKVIDKGKADSKANAQAWIRANCFVQWLTEEDADLRCWAEHYMLSVLRPIWGR